MLGVGLMIKASLSGYLSSNLLDHITPLPHMNPFTNLIYVRLILYYGLGVQCLPWYYSALNDLQRECVEAQGRNVSGSRACNPTNALGSRFESRRDEFEEFSRIDY
jgi:hypothetical protein